MKSVKLIFLFILLSLKLNGQQRINFIFPNYEEQGLLLVRNYVNVDLNNRSHYVYLYISEPSELTKNMIYRDSNGTFRDFISMNFFNWFYNDLETLTGQRLDSLHGEFDFHRGFFYSKKDSIDVFEVLKNYSPTLPANLYKKDDEFTNVFKNYQLPDYSRLDIFDYYFSNTVANRIKFLELNFKKLDTYQIQIIIDDLNTLLNTNEKYPMDFKGKLLKGNIKKSIRNWKSNSLINDK